VRAETVAYVLIGAGMGAVVAVLGMRVYESRRVRSALKAQREVFRRLWGKGGDRG
jgi:hypothetical protein